MPFVLRHAFFRALYRVAVGRVEDYGLPKPGHRLLESHPTLSADFLDRVAQGEVGIRPAIAALEGDRVWFVDGRVESVDVIVWCTGYKVSFPVFDEDFISAPDNELLLYRRVFKPGVENLFFIALLQALGPTMPVAEAQGRWIAAYLRDEYRLPSVPEMEVDVRRERERLRRRYVPRNGTRWRSTPTTTCSRCGRDEGRRAPGARRGLPAAGAGPRASSARRDGAGRSLRPAHPWAALRSAA